MEAKYSPLPPPSPLSPSTPIAPRSASKLPRCSTAIFAIIALWATFLTLVFATIAPQFIWENSIFDHVEDASAERTGHCKDRLGGVASENTICSKIGIDMLRRGGNAADALIATTFCVGVIGMAHSGIGGGGFMLVRSPNGTYESIDFRETAPAAAFQDMYKHNVDGSLYGGLASGVPGEIRGFQYLHERYGSLPWQTLVQPAVDVARYGFPVTQDLMDLVHAETASKEDFLSLDPTWAIDFAPNGTRIDVGDIIYRKRYADTLETIGREGPDAFYTGAMAETMVRAVQASNGTMTMEDVRSYQVAIRRTAQIDYRGYRLFSVTAPSSGGVALAVLNTVKEYDDFFDEGTLNISTHRLDEAMRFGYGQRANLGDPKFVDGLDDYLADMRSDTTALRNKEKISDDHTLPVSEYDPDGFESLDDHGTSHVVTADHTGLAITLTTTINTLFGSHLMVPETGIIMNNEMNDFSIPGVRNAFGYVPSPSNYVHAGKRPLSSITPVIVEYPDGKLYYVIGAAGGSRIITSTIQNLVNVLDRNMTVPEALAQPRLHDQLIPNEITFEYAYDNSTVAYLKERGHNVTWIAPGQSKAQGLRMMRNGTFEVAGEPRQVASGGYAI